MVFLFILMAIAILMVILFFSKIKIQIVNFRFNSQTKRHMNKDYEIIIKLYILGKIPIFKINITKMKFEKIKLKEKIENIDFKTLEEKIPLDKELFHIMKKFKFSIDHINLQISIGTENASLTSILIPVISTVISYILRKKMKRLQEQKFIIHPIYQNQNLVNIYFSGIFEIKMRYIIDILYSLRKKEKKGVKKYERTSNRRTYDYSYE